MYVCMYPDCAASAAVEIQLVLELEGDLCLLDWIPAHAWLYVYTQTY